MNECMNFLLEVQNQLSVLLKVDVKSYYFSTYKPAEENALEVSVYISYIENDEIARGKDEEMVELIIDVKKKLDNEDVQNLINKTIEIRDYFLRKTIEDYIIMHSEISVPYSLEHMFQEKLFLSQVKIRGNRYVDV